MSIKQSTVCLAALISLANALPASRYPADTLLVSDSAGILQKSGILPIALWQRVSYNLPGLGCQFYPSCSNYGAQAISEFGFPAGLAVTADRVTRCNPFAWHYHIELQGDYHKPDGRLVDPTVPEMNTGGISTKSPLLAAVMSAVLPGSGRIYAGRTADGLLGLFTVSIAASNAWYGFENDKPVGGSIFLAMAIIFYSGEVYGAWRSAKYYQPPPD